MIEREQKENFQELCSGNSFIEQNINVLGRMFQNVKLLCLTLFVLLSTRGSVCAITTSYTGETLDANPVVTASVDSDGDGVADVDDLDDDNDGILDVDELSCPDVFVSLGKTFNRANSSGTIKDLYPNGSVSVSMEYKLLNNATWSSGVKSSSDTKIGDYINVQPRKTNFPLTSYYPEDGTNIKVAVYTLTYSEPVYNVEFSWGGIDVQDRVDFLANNSGIDVPLSVIKVDDTINQLIVDNQRVYESDEIEGGAGNAPKNAVKVSADRPITQLVIVAGKHDDGNGNNVTMQFYNHSYDIEKDSDNDGIPDHLDLDSDNDGCPDALEGDGEFDYSQIGSRYSNLIGDVDVNGVPLIANGGQNIGTAYDSSEQSDICNPCNVGNPKFQDFDGDGIGNICDLDDDNDGIIDGGKTYEYEKTIDNLGECTETQIEWFHNNATNDTGYDGQSDYATFENSGSWRPNYSYLTSPNFTNYDDLVFGVGLDEASYNEASTYVFSGVEALSYEEAKSVNDYVQVAYEPTVDMILGNVRLGFSTQLSSSDNNLDDLGEFFVTLEMDTDSDFGDPTVLFYDGYVSELENEYITLGYDYDIDLTAGTKYYYRFYIYYVNNDYPQEHMARFDDLLFKHRLACDADGDGQPNFRDTDSDNDGCPDALEGDGTYIFSDLDANDMLVYDVDTELLSETYGVPNSNAQGIGSSQDASEQSSECNSCDSESTLFTDNDNDGVGDDCDLDDDNDGILDEEECDEFAKFKVTYTTDDYDSGAYSNGDNIERRFDINIDSEDGSYFESSDITSFDIYYNIPYYGIDDSQIAEPEDLNNIEVSFLAGIYDEDSDEYGNDFCISTKRIWVGGTFEVEKDGNKMTIEIPYTDFDFCGSGDEFFNLSSIFAGICDADDDGIPNHLDPDSDDDGCPDALEGDGGFTFDDLDGDQLSGDVDEDGIPNGVTQDPGTSYDESIQSRVCYGVEVETNYVNNITETTAKLHGTVVAGNGIIGYGFIWSYDDNDDATLNYEDNKIEVYEGTSLTAAEIDSPFMQNKTFTPRKNVYFRAYARTGDDPADYVYGKVVRFLTEKRDFSLSLDGSSALLLDKASIAASVNNFTVDDFTVEFWIKNENRDKVYQTILSNEATGSGVKIILDNSGHIGVESDNIGVVLSDIAITNNEWHHVAVVAKYGSSNPTVYLDGVASTLSSINLVKPTIDAVLTIGADYSDSGFSNYFTGKIDALRFWSCELSSDVISMICYDNLQQSSNGNVEVIGSGIEIYDLDWSCLLASFDFNVRSTKEFSSTNSIVPTVYNTQDDLHNYPFFHENAHLATDNISFNIVSIGTAKPSPDLPRVNWRHDAVYDNWVSSDSWSGYAYPGEGISSAEISVFEDVSSTVVVDTEELAEYTVINEASLIPVVRTKTFPNGEARLAINRLVDREESIKTYQVDDVLNDGSLDIKKGARRTIFGTRVENKNSGVIIVESGSVEPHDGGDDALAKRYPKWYFSPISDQKIYAGGTIDLKLNDSISGVIPSNGTLTWSFTIDQALENLIINSTTGMLNYTNTPAKDGTYRVTVTATDEYGGNVSRTFVLVLSSL